MHPVRQLGSLVIGCFITVSCYSQQPFTNCSAAFLNDKLVVDEYTDTGKCSLDSTATGILTVCTADLSPTVSYPVKKLQFKVALRDRNTRTLMMYSDKTYEQVNIREVLAKCRKGDHIVLLTMKNEYALPHNEILIK